MVFIVVYEMDMLGVIRNFEILEAASWFANIRRVMDDFEVTT